MGKEYYHHQAVMPFPEGSRLPELEPTIERLVWYAEAYGRLRKENKRLESNRITMKSECDQLSKTISELDYNLARRDREVDSQRTEISALRATIEKLEKKLPKKKTKKAVKKAK